MTHFQHLLYCLSQEESGQDLVEYALVMALIALGAVASMQTLAASISTEFTNLNTTITGSF